ncbi:MAG TPA: hypothetical protein PK967_18250 [Candidatus Hydrogenedentes bacterium]|nr:hypothetical protein [Candidatus Hydrogenedentota bacterium]
MRNVGQTVQQAGQERILLESAGRRGPQTGPERVFLESAGRSNRVAYWRYARQVTGQPAQ